MKALFYGSLRKGFRNHDVARGAKFVGHAKTVENFRLYVHFRDGELGIPAAIPDATGRPLLGEVYELSPSVAQNVDWLEHGYRKHKVSVTVNGEILNDVTVYVCDSLETSAYRSGEDVEAVSGDYADYCDKQGRRIRPSATWNVVVIPEVKLLEIAL